MKAHNVYQIRKDVALGVRAMHRTSDKSFAELHSRIDVRNLKFLRIDGEVERESGRRTENAPRPRKIVRQTCL
jgi:hypothetical protein